MSTKEQRAWNYLYPKLQKAHGTKAHLERIESGGTVSGQPDVDYCIQGALGDLELKAATSETQFDCHLRPAQYQWMKRRIAAGGHPWVLLRVEEFNNWYLISGLNAKELIRKPTFQNWTELAACKWANGINIDELSDYLRGKRI